MYFLITPRDVESRSMSEEKKKEAKYSYFAFYIGRPLTYVLTVPFLYFSISPNVVTVVSILFAVAGFIFLSFGATTPLRLRGVFLFFLWSMGDGIDGNIARYKNIKSENGDLLDTLGGYVAATFLLLAMGCCAYNDPHGPKWVNGYFNVYIVLGGLSAIFTLIPRTLMHRKRARLNNIQSNTDFLTNKEHFGALKVLALNLADPAGIQLILCAISVACHLSWLFTIFYFFFNLFVFIYSILGMLE